MVVTLRVVPIHIQHFTYQELGGIVTISRHAFVIGHDRTGQPENRPKTLVIIWYRVTSGIYDVIVDTYGARALGFLSSMSPIMQNGDALLSQ